MQAHPYFSNLMIHTDAELETLLGIAITERETLNEWPLSWVQRLRLADGTTLVYKSQLPPTVEPQFYDAASSPLLPGYGRLGKLGECEVMLLDWIDAQLLQTTTQDEHGLVAHGRALVARIGEIGGDLPLYLDIGSAETWTAAVESTLSKLQTLIADGRFNLVAAAAVDQLRTWANSAQVMDAIAKESRVTHGDLKPDQVFVTADGYRVIDWQRPVLGPPEIDLASLLIFAGFNPLPYVSAPVVGIHWFLYVFWAVVAQHDLFPQFGDDTFDQWVAEALGHIFAQ